MTRYVRNDAAVPWPMTEDRAYEIRDERDRLLGVVAGHGGLGRWSSAAAAGSWASSWPRAGGQPLTGWSGVDRDNLRRLPRLQAPDRRERRALVAPGDVNPILFPFQRDLVRWAVRKGRAALFADTGLGKTFMQIEWARLIGRSDADRGAALGRPPDGPRGREARRAGDVHPRRGVAGDLHHQLRDGRALRPGALRRHRPGRVQHPQVTGRQDAAAPHGDVRRDAVPAVLHRDARTE